MTEEKPIQHRKSRLTFKTVYTEETPEMAEYRHMKFLEAAYNFMARSVAEQEPAHPTPRA